MSEIGTFELRPINLEKDIEAIHKWVNKEYAIYWGMMGFSFDEVKIAYEKIVKNTQVYIGTFNGIISFLLECYNPKEDVINNYYNVEKGDRGMHILVAPSENPIKNFTWSIFTVILDFIFNDSEVKRIVVEPDARNYKIHQLNKKAGFVFQRIVELPHKKAHLEFCTREDYYKALEKL
ncbi:siderophore biosynthesis protein [Flavobacterium sp. 316]|nr:siderophore biosynthesis protein [Flavobacterium sp. 316]